MENERKNDEQKIAQAVAEFRQQLEPWKKANAQRIKLLRQALDLTEATLVEAEAVMRVIKPLGTDRQN